MWARTGLTCWATRALPESFPPPTTFRSDLPVHSGSARHRCTSGSPRSGTAGEVGGVRLAIEDLEGCPRLLAAVIRGVKVGPSPDWLVRRLEAAGSRSINNVVDATNYVMLELDQPMHAYDIARLRGPSVIVRRAQAGETVVTLDGVERKLTPEMTVIADDAGAIGIAGVMGGAATEVTADTVDVFLECAYFTPGGIRHTRRTLGLSTEASYRFERGIDRWGGVDALRRCIEIIGATAGGELIGRSGGRRAWSGEPASHFSPTSPGDPAAWRRAAVGVAGELPGRHRRHARIQAGR